MNPVTSTKSKSRRPQLPQSMREIVALSLLLAPRGGVAVHRHGQGMDRGSSASSVKP
jgi:hypothetical protein